MRLREVLVDVAVNIPPVRGTFHYHLPPELRGHVGLGHLLTVPFGPRRVQGVVIGMPAETDLPETRPVESLVDPDPVMLEPQLQLAHWLHEQYLTPLIDCIAMMIPPGLSQRADMLYTVVDPDIPPPSHTAERLLRLLLRRGPLRGTQIKRALGRLEWRRAAEQLMGLGSVTRSSVLDPPTVHPRRVRTARLAVPPAEAEKAMPHLGRSGGQASQRRAALLRQLITERQPLEVTWLYAESGANAADLRLLAEKGLIALGETEIWRDPLAETEVALSTPPILTTDQAAVWQAIKQKMHHAQPGKSSPILLHGVTGSGKTELYLRAVAECLNLQRTAIVLVPEIALTPQIVRRFLARFPGVVGLMHSKLSSGERYDTWRRARRGLLSVIIGARSALFTPLRNIGLIVVDECHDESYKEQGLAPRHHAVQTAQAYADILGATCILGSATPNITTYYRAEQGALRLLSLPQRILGHSANLAHQAARWGVSTRYRPAEGSASQISLPPVRVVDMRQELRAGNRSIFSRPLYGALQEALQANQQAILFLNRRGSATYVFCRQCGKALHCPRCEVPLTYHGARQKLLCHHCGYERRAPSTCPSCGSPQVKHFGIGTQRVESEVQRIFPGTRTLRWDWDTTRAKGAHDVILAHFAAHRADVLVGTQMIAKGLDLPLVTLVGVVSADTGLNLPDYRSAERIFQVLTQVAGRAGRGLLGGQVILQTYQPEHEAIRAAAHHDYAAFYAEELENRRRLGYPPFSRLAKLVYRHTSARRAQAEAERLAAQVRQRMAAQRGQAQLVGPVPCFFRRLRGDFRWQIIIRASNPLPFIPEGLPEGWAVDIDPVSLL
jgi:primosomal protein N' (replication factor Y)